MDIRRFFINKNLNESVSTSRVDRYSLAETFDQLNRLYEDTATKEDEVAEETGKAEDKAEDKAEAAKPEEAKAEEGAEDAEEAKEVLDKLKDSDYEQFVTILNSDGKSKAFLDYLKQHYELGDDSIKTIKKSGAGVAKAKCSQLTPTQQNISLSKSLGMIKSSPAWAKKIIETPIDAFDTPTVTYAGKYIIDGHHRWSKAYALNGGDSSIKVLNFPAIEGVTWEDMLKAVQLAIVSTNPSASLINDVGNDNMLTTDKETIYKYVIDNISDEVVDTLKANGRGDTKEAAAQKITDNVIGMQQNQTSQPVDGAPQRQYMPQMDDEGKAENKLKTAVIDLT